VLKYGLRFLGSAVAVILVGNGGALAMNSPSASNAAPIPLSSGGIDPLVAVSLFGTASSAATVESVAAQQAAQVTCPPGKVLRPPLANEPAGPPVCVDSDVPVAAVPPPAPSAAAFIPLIAVAGVAVAAAGGHGSGTGNLSPVSPA
jgi:hypothetical protein